MRYILLLLSLLMLGSASAQVQYLGSPTTTVRNRGNFVSDSLFYLPKRTKAPSDTAALRYQISDSTVYVWTGSQWRAVSVSGLYVPYTGAISDVDLGNFSLNAKSLHIKGTGGQGHLGLKHQNAVPSISASESGLYANVMGDLAWQNDNLHASTFKTSNQTASRTYTFQNKSYTLADSADVALKVNISDTASMLSPYTRGSGTTNYLPKFTGTRTLGNSVAYDDGTNLSVGNTSPARKFHVTQTSGDLARFEMQDATKNAVIEIQHTNPNAAGTAMEAGINFLSPNTNTRASIRTYPSDTFNVRNYLSFFTPSGSGTNAERMRIQQDGEVLIGTTSDAGTYALQVSGNIIGTSFVKSGGTSSQYLMADGSTTTNAITGSGTINRHPKFTASGTIGNSSIDDSSTSVRMTILSDGRIGFGATSNAQLTIREPSLGGLGAEVIRFVGNGSNNNYMRGYWVSSTGTALAELTVDGTDQMRFGTLASVPLLLMAGGSERARITSDGELLIATTTDAGDYKLQVNGNIYANGKISATGDINSTGIISSTNNYRFNNAAFSQLGIVDANGAFAGGYNLTISGTTAVHAATGGIAGYYFHSETNRESVRFYADSSRSSGTTTPERMRINANGNVGIGTTSPTERLHVSGNILTASPSGGTAKPFKIGEAATVSPTSPNRTIRVEIDGTVYYIHAKTTND